MLVLKRAQGEAVVISRDGEEIGRVIVVEHGGHAIKLGFEFPREYDVDREEIFDQYRGKK